jgi:hypothetical protein
MAETTATEIAEFTKGDKERTAMHAESINELVKAINKLLKMEVKPEGKLTVSDANAVLEVSGTGCDEGESCVPDPPESGTFVLGGINGEMVWMSTQECECGVDGGDA